MSGAFLNWSGCHAGVEVCRLPMRFEELRVAPPHAKLHFNTDGFFLHDDGSGGKPYHHAAHHVSLGLHYAQTLRWPVAVVLIVVALCLALKDASA